MDYQKKIKIYLKKDKHFWRNTWVQEHSYTYTSNYLEGIVITKNYLRYVEDIRARHVFEDHKFPKNFDEFLEIVGRKQ